MCVSSLTPMTAKDLLSIRLIGEDFEANKKHELRRLQTIFRGKCLKFLLRHPNHGCVASGEIPILAAESHEEVFGPQNLHLNVHYKEDFFGSYSMEDYLECNAALQLLPDTDFIQCADYERDKRPYQEEADPDDQWGLGFGVEMEWKWWLLFPNYSDYINFAGFPDYDTEWPPYSINVSLTCINPKDVPEDDEDWAVPKVWNVNVFISIEDYSIDSAFKYLKLMDTWFVAASHMQLASTELSRMQQRFRDTYMLIEVEDKQSGGQYAFALVPFRDETALLALFNGQETSLQFTTANRELFLVEENRRVVFSILDLGDKSQAIKVGIHDSSGFRSLRQLEFLGQEVRFQAQIEENSDEGEDGTIASSIHSTFRVKLQVVTGIVNVIGDSIESEPRVSNICDLYQFLEIVMTVTWVKED